MSNNDESSFVKFIAEKYEKIANPDIDDDVRNRYFKEFEQLNTTTSSIYDLGDLEVLIILKDGTNLTSWMDVEDKNDILYVSEDLSKKRYLYSRYENLESLKAMVVKGVTDKVFTMEFMFLYCSSLEYVFGMDTWDISNLKDMTAMFMGCASLRDISFLESLDISNVKTMKSVFQSCISLKDLSPLKYWDVSNAEDMQAIFAMCISLDSLEGLESWDVSNVKRMESMFHQCMSLKDISMLGMWKADSIENMFEMFRDCTGLKSADTLLDWDINGNVNVRDMFKYSGVLQKPDWYLDSINEIEEYITSIDDEDVLIDIAYNHSDLDTRKVAIEHISDENVLKGLIVKNTEPAILEAAIKNDNLDDDDFLMFQIEDAKCLHEGMNFILFSLNEDYNLARIAMGNYPLHYCLIAVNIISEKSVLEDIAVGGDNETIRNLALNRLENLE